MKPYDLKELLAELKINGLDIAEDATMSVYESVQSWLLKSAAASDNRIDDLLLVILPAADKFVREQIDLIDGKVDAPLEEEKKDPPVV